MTMERDMPDYTPDYQEALMKALNRRGEPRNFYGFIPGDMVQIDLTPVHFGEVAPDPQYLEGYVTNLQHTLVAVEDASDELQQFIGHEIGLGSDTVLRPPRGPQMPATLFGAMVAGREAVLYQARLADSFYSKFRHPHEDIQYRPFARYGRVMVRGVTLFDVRDKSTL